MGERLLVGTPQYVTSYTGQLSLAIPLWVGAMSTGDAFGHRKGRNSEFCVAVGPVHPSCNVAFRQNNNNNKVDVLHVRLTDLHAAHKNLPFPPNRTLPLKQYQYQGRL